MGIVITKIKFRYSEKTKKFQNNLTILVTLLSNVKQIGRFLQHFVAFSEHLNLKIVFECVFFFYFSDVLLKHTAPLRRIYKILNHWHTLALSFSSCSDISCWSRSSSEKVTFEVDFPFPAKKEIRTKKFVKLFHLKSPLKEIFRFRMYPDSHFRCLHRGPPCSCRWQFQAEKI